MDKPWLQLSPNDFITEWWRYSYIIDEDRARIFKDEQEILCHFIIQDCNMAGTVIPTCGSRGTYTPTASESQLGLIDRELNGQPQPPSAGSWCYRASITVQGQLFWTPYFLFVR